MGGTDDRACNACTCVVSGTTCIGGGYTIYEYDNCQGGNTMNLTSVNCVDVSDQLDDSTGAIKANSVQATGGTCSPAGGEPTGTVTKTGVVTYCCE